MHTVWPQLISFNININMFLQLSYVGVIAMLYPALQIIIIIHFSEKYAYPVAQVGSVKLVNLQNDN